MVVMTSSSPLSRRQFLRGVAATAAVAPFLSIPLRGQTVTKVRHASIGTSGQAFSDLNSFSKHPAFDLVAVALIYFGWEARIANLLFKP